MQTPQTPAGNPMGGWGPVFGHLQDSMASLVEPSLVWTLRGLGRPQNPSPATLRAAGVMGIALLYLLLSLLLACLTRLEQHCRTSPGAPLMLLSNDIDDTASSGCADLQCVGKPPKIPCGVCQLFQHLISAATPCCCSPLKS